MNSGVERPWKFEQPDSTCWSPVFRPPCKRNVFQKGQKVDPLEIKSGSVQFWSLFHPFIVINLLKRLFQVEADLTSKQLRLESN